MLKVLIADSSPVLTRALSQLLSESYDVKVCDDGEDTLALLQEFQPDILIIHMLLPRADGLSVLQQTRHRPKIMIALTGYVNTYLEYTLIEQGVDYIMVAPSVHAIKMRLEDLVRRQIIVPDPLDLQALTTGYLHALGIPSHLDGYRQLCVALPMFARDSRQLMTKELYPTIAKVCGCKDGRSVEHSIRKAIQIAWNHRNDNIWRKYFPPDPRGCIPCPSNKEFICVLAEFLKQ